MAEGGKAKKNVEMWLTEHEHTFGSWTNKQY